MPSAFAEDFFYSVLASRPYDGVGNQRERYCFRFFDPAGVYIVKKRSKFSNSMRLCQGILVCMNLVWDFKSG